MVLGLVIVCFCYGLCNVLIKDQNKMDAIKNEMYLTKTESIDTTQRSNI